MSYLIDTNVFSEKPKPRPNEKAVAWLAENESELFVSTFTIAEIGQGIEHLKASAAISSNNGSLHSARPWHPQLQSRRRPHLGTGAMAAGSQGD